MIKALLAALLTLVSTQMVHAELQAVPNVQLSAASRMLQSSQPLFVVRMRFAGLSEEGRPRTVHRIFQVSAETALDTSGEASAVSQMRLQFTPYQYEWQNGADTLRDDHATNAREFIPIIATYTRNLALRNSGRLTVEVLRIDAHHRIGAPDLHLIFDLTASFLGFTLNNYMSPAVGSREDFQRASGTIGFQMGGYIGLNDRFALHIDLINARGNAAASNGLRMSEGEIWSRVSVSLLRPERDRQGVHLERAQFYLRAGLELNNTFENEAISQSVMLPYVEVGLNWNL